MSKPHKRLLDQVRDQIRLRHYSIRTEQAYISWIKRYILFHGNEIEDVRAEIALAKHVLHERPLLQLLQK